MVKELSRLTTVQAARWLLGKKLVRRLDEFQLSGVIVETEAYLQNDLAAHSYGGLTRRNQVMFGSSGFLYVYFTYGIHYCINIVTSKKGTGEAVLIRALEPREGIEQMKQLRKSNTIHNLTNGPAKLAQALQIDLDLNAHNLESWPLQLQTGITINPNQVVQTKRIGISKAKDSPYRFYLKNNKFVSQK